jgi:hemerythrin
VPLMTWTEDLTVGIPTIDAQHHRWLDMINDLHEAMRAGAGKERIDSILAEMVAYTRTHFATEEKLLSTHKYPEYAQHKALHDAFVLKVQDMLARQSSGKSGLTLEVMSTLKDWLINHIQKVDVKYVAHLQSKGVR